MQKSNANGRFFIDLTIRWHGHEWLFWGRASPFLGEGGNVGNRRILLVAARSGKGLLSERRAGPQPRRQEALFVPPHPVVARGEPEGLRRLGSGHSLPRHRLAQCVP